MGFDCFLPLPYQLQAFAHRCRSTWPRYEAVTGTLLVRLTWHEDIYPCRGEAITPHVVCRDWSRHDLFRDTWDLAQKVTDGDLSQVDAFAEAQKEVP